MRSAVITRRGDHRASAGWSPANLAGALAWWHMDDLTGANGSTATASPADRIGGMVLNTAVGTPTVKVGANGRKAVTTSASSGLVKTGGIGSLPNGTGQYAVLIVAQAASTTTDAIIFEVSSSSNNGWCVDIKSGQICPRANGPGLANSGISDYSPNFGGFIYAGRKSNGTVDVSHSALYPVPAFNGSLPAANAGAATVSLGYSSGFGGFGYPGDIYDVIVCSAALTNSDLYKFADWVYTTYGFLTGTTYNTATNVTTNNGQSPTTQTTCIEPSVLYFPSGWNGHTYWMAYSPLDAGNTANENPSVLVSDDGNTWSVPTGLTNPVVPYPGGGTNGNNADAAFFDNIARDGKVWLLNLVETGGSTQNGVWARSTTDGITYSTATKLIGTTTNSDNLDPKIFYDGTQYVMIAVNGSANPANTLRRWTASSVTGTWTEQTISPTNPIPNGLAPFHLGNIIKIGSKWVLPMSDTFKTGANTTRNIWLATSTDGVNWTCTTRPILTQSQGGHWDSSGQYRLSLVDSGDGSNMWGWYSAITNNGDLSTAHLSQRITIPFTALP